MRKQNNLEKHAYGFYGHCNVVIYKGSRVQLHLSTRSMAYSELISQGNAFITHVDTLHESA
jgi:hypothetical protein